MHHHVKLCCPMVGRRIARTGSLGTWLLSLVLASSLAGCSGEKSEDVDAGAPSDAAGEPAPDAPSDTGLDQGLPEADTGLDQGVPDADAQPDQDTGPDAKPDTGPPVDCSLEVLAHGVLPVPLDSAMRFEGPHVLATNQGFLVVFGQEAPGMQQGFVLQVGVDGTLGAGAVVPNDGCPGSPSMEGIATAWSADLGAGFFALSRKGCPNGSGPRMLLANFDAEGATIASASYDLPSRIDLESNQAAAAGAWGADFLIAGLVAGQGAFLYSADGVSMTPNVEAIPPGVSNGDLALVATSPQVHAVMGGTSNDPILTLRSTSTSAEAAVLGEWGSGPTALAAWDERAMVARASVDGVRLLSAGLDGTGFDESQIDTEFRTSVDIATLGDHVFVAAGGLSEDIAIWRIDGARSVGFDTTVAATQNLSPATTPSLATFDGVRLGLGAGHNRVLVAWALTSALVLNASLPAAGYALMACGK